MCRDFFTAPAHNSIPVRLCVSTRQRKTIDNLLVHVVNGFDAVVDALRDVHNVNCSGRLVLQHEKDSVWDLGSVVDGSDAQLDRSSQVAGM